MCKAADWLVSIQNADGGWGEDGTSYKLDYRGYESAPLPIVRPTLACVAGSRSRA